LRNGWYVLLQSAGTPRLSNSAMSIAVIGSAVEPSISATLRPHSLMLRLEESPILTVANPSDFDLLHDAHIVEKKPD
jgi:hypothetical protein